MRDTKGIGLWILYTIPGIIFGALFLVSIFTLLDRGLLPPSIRSGFLYDAGRIFRGKPLVIPVLFIIFFGAYLLQGFFTFSEKNRDRAFAGAALGGVSLSLVILIHTFWELSHLIVSLGSSIIVGLLIATYFLSPWKDWLIDKIHKGLNEANGIISGYLPIITEIRELTGDLNLKIYNEIDEYKEEISNIARSIEDTNANLKLEYLKSEDLKDKVKLLKDIDKDEEVIKSDIRQCSNEIDEHASKLEEKNLLKEINSKILLNNLLKYHLSDDLMELYEDTIGERK